MPEIKRVYWDTLISGQGEVFSDLSHVLYPISKKLSENGLDYLYEFSYRYGELVQEGGKLILPDFKSAERSQLIPSDLDYAEIPLGIVIENELEKYSSFPFSGVGFQESSGPVKVNYPVAHSKLRKGELTGICNTLDFVTTYRSGISDSRIQGPSDWLQGGDKLVAGSHAVMPVLPHSFLERYEKEISFRHPDNLEQNRYGLAHESDCLIRFIEDQIGGEQWEAKVLFFPRHWLIGEEKEFSMLHLELFRLAWPDLETSQNQFFSKSYSRLQSFDHKEFLGAFFKHLDAVFRHEKPVMKLVDPDQESGLFSNILNWLNERFSNEQALEQYQPLLFRYDYLGVGEWGLISTTVPQLMGPGFESFSKCRSNNKWEMLEEASAYVSDLLPALKKKWNYIRFLSGAKGKQAVIDRVGGHVKGKKNAMSKYPFFRSFIMVEDEEFQEIA